MTTEKALAQAARELVNELWLKTIYSQDEIWQDIPKAISIVRAAFNRVRALEPKP